MAKYRKKPVEVEAFQWTGGPDQIEDPEWIVDAIRNEDVTFVHEGTHEVGIVLTTAQGERVTAEQGEWIIAEGPNYPGRFYPCDSAIFEATYEPV